MAKNSGMDELLESLWYAYESEQPATFEMIRKRSEREFTLEELEELKRTGMVSADGENGILSFTEKGEEHTRLLIRSHRLAERLIYDILGAEFETGACEFEHITNIGLVDAICTLLGHPRECPHGLPIPEGQCCRESADTVKRAVKPLTELEIGQEARVAYVYSKSDQQLHVIEGMQINPGTMLRLHQKMPTYVISIEDAHIAIDDEVAANIQIWADTCEFSPTSPRHVQYDRHGEPVKRGRSAGGRGRRAGQRGRRNNTTSNSNQFEGKPRESGYYPPGEAPE